MGLFPADDLTLRKEGSVMDMMSSIAAQSMSLSAATVAQQYSVSVAKKVMDSQELAAQELLEMLPQQPQVPMGQHLDVYA